MPSRDCFIWIDQSYRTINQFLREARIRGCCRKVSAWPSWVEPGKTRVFLAHRDGHRTRTRGAIFGYFVLGGVDVVLTQQDCDEYKDLMAEHGTTPGGRRDRESLRAYWHTPQGRRQLAPALEYWHKRFPHGGLPYRVPPASNKGNHGGPKKPQDGLDDIIIDFFLDYLISCDPKADPHGHCGYGIPTPFTRLEAPRPCGETGLRDRPERPGERPAVYLVDKLERHIASEFCKAIKDLIKAALKGEERRRRTRGKRRTLVARRSAEANVLKTLLKKARANPDERGGLPEFWQVVERAGSRRALQARVPASLNRIAQSQGAMVVFREPYPYFQRTPQAAFRGIERTDGDELLRRIRRAYRTRKDAGTSPEVVVPLMA